ncbi:MAG: BBP7 family outer membrane beta-barrel protein [Planctomycetes bacterium]|nr:BBP7 family outer membrane beta-barrel protein [Planctomycetota bacterium]
MGQPAYYAPQPAAYGAPAGYAMMPSVAPYGVGPGYAVPASYAGGGPEYFQEPVMMDDSMGHVCDGSCGSEACGGRHHWGRGLASILELLHHCCPGCLGADCQPHWFDIHAEAVFMNLDDDRRFIEFSRDTSGNTLITSNDLDYDEEAGMRITGTHQTGPGSNLEFTYLGMFDFSQSKRVTGNEDLLSVFSDFTQQLPPDGLEQFDLANMHRVLLSNNFDSFELNYRRRWIGPTCAFQGSWLVGVRYAQVLEKIRWRSYAERDTNGDGLPDTGGVGHYALDASNYMPGAQLGGDMWVSLLPGLRVGVDGKFGLYGNNVSQRTRIFSYDLLDNYQGFLPLEKVSNDKATFIGELNLMLTYRLTHSLTVRGGYEVVWIDGVATALDNFNPDVPQLTTRTPILSDGGRLVYDGVSIGAEWMW